MFRNVVETAVQIIARLSRLTARPLPFPLHDVSLGGPGGVASLPVNYEGQVYLWWSFRCTLAFDSRQARITAQPFQHVPPGLLRSLRWVSVILTIERREKMPRTAFPNPWCRCNDRYSLIFTTGPDSIPRGSLLAMVYQISYSQVASLARWPHRSDSGFSAGRHCRQQTGQCRVTVSTLQFSRNWQFRSQ